MADTKRQATEPTAETATKVESKYGAAEFAANAKALFGVMPECVVAAFRVEGIQTATKAEAKKIIEKFMKKEVK